MATITGRPVPEVKGLGYATTHTLFTPHIATDGGVQTLMHDTGRTSIWMRTTFQVADPTVFTLLKLRMKYDDGFVAYLNGARVASANADLVVPQPWNAVATQEHPDAAGALPEEFVLGSNAPLVVGTNVLAMHGSECPGERGQRPACRARTRGSFGAATRCRRGVLFAVDPGRSKWRRHADHPSACARRARVGPATGRRHHRGGFPARVFRNPRTRRLDLWIQNRRRRLRSIHHFTPFVGGAGLGAWDGAAQQWNGTVWAKKIPVSAPWTSIGRGTARPNDSLPGPLDAPIIRWVSDVAGPADHFRELQPHLGQRRWNATAASFSMERNSLPR